MKNKGKAVFSAYRQVVRRRVDFFQRCLSVCLIVCIAYLIWYRRDSLEAARKNQELQRIAWQTAKVETDQQDIEEQTVIGSVVDVDEKSEEGESESNESADATRDSESSDEVQFGDVAGFAELLKINQDMRGWINIPGTVLSLPVVQGIDNSYYLNHDFYGAQDRHGTIFFDCEADLFEGEPNIVIYGHNMRDGSMFGILKEYRKEAFYKEHPSFFVYMQGEAWEYKIMAVLRNDIFTGNDETFQYYDYKQIEDEETFEEYCQAVRERAIYDTGVEAQAGDELVTLCTCDYMSANQRLLVIGKKTHPAIDNPQE